MILEIIFGVLVALFVIFIFGREIYKKIHKIPTGECASCASRNVRWIKEYRKQNK